MKPSHAIYVKTAELKARFGKKSSATLGQDITWTDISNYLVVELLSLLGSNTDAAYEGDDIVYPAPPPH